MLLQPSQGDAQNVRYFTYTLGAPGNTTEIGLKGDIGTEAVQPGGAYAFTYPIEVPLGPGGVAPSLAVVHSGEGDDLWIGKGWSLELGTVTRDTRKGVPIHLDGAEPPDRFLLNGSLLVRVRDSTRFRTEIESHQYIEYTNNFWTVMDPDGTISKYSKVVEVPNTVLKRAWLLETVTDPVGNTITYHYFPTEPTGAVYPKSIVWGTPGHYRALRFELDDLPYTRTSYASGSKVVQTKSLKWLDVLMDPNVNSQGNVTDGVIVRAYNFQTETSPDTYASRLVAITEVGRKASAPAMRDEAALSNPDLSKKTQFQYHEGKISLGNQISTFFNDAVFWSEESKYNLSPAGSPPFDTFNQYRTNTEVADLDNDGIPEIIQGRGGQYGTDSSDSVVWRLANLVNSTWTPNSGLAVPTTFRESRFGTLPNPSDISIDHGARFLDLDRDGDQDLIIDYIYRGWPGPGDGEHKVWLNKYRDGGSWQLVDTAGSGPYEMPLAPDGNSLSFSYYEQDQGVRVADVNGDGRPDLIHAFAPETSFATEAGYYPYARNPPPASAHLLNDCYDEQRRPRPPDGQGVYIMNASGEWVDDGSFLLPAEIFFVGPVPKDRTRWSCPDGNNWETPPPPPLGEPDFYENSFDAAVDSDLGTQILDVNGDGLPDIVKETRHQYNLGALTETRGQNGVWLNNGHGWDRDASWSSDLTNLGARLHTNDDDCLSSSNCRLAFMLVDVNDDGLPDILRHKKFEQSSAVGPDVYQYFLNTGDGWEPNEAPTLSTKDYTVDETGLRRAEMLQDFNGDGRVDYLAASQENVYSPPNADQTYTTFTFRASPNSHPDKLSKVINWMGGVTDLSYKHSTSERVSHNGELPQVRLVVDEVGRECAPTNSGMRAHDPSTGGTGTSITKYDFLGGRFDFSRREFRGFRYVKSIAFARSDHAAGTDHSLDVIMETVYHQDHELKGLPELTITRNEDGTVSSAKKFVYNCEVPGLDCNGLDENGLAIPGVTDRHQKTVREYDPAALHHPEPGDPNYHLEGETLVQRVEEIFDHEMGLDFYGTSETYGNVVERIEWGPDVAGDKRKQTWTYHPNANPGSNKWLVSYPAVTEVSKLSETTPKGRTTLFYDYSTDPDSPPIRGLLTSSEDLNQYQFDTVPGHPTVKLQNYDQNTGNLLSTTDANGRVTSFEYDSSGSYITKLTKPLGQATTLCYYGVSGCVPVGGAGSYAGNLQSFTGPNADTTSYAFDRIGRLTQVDLPGTEGVADAVYEYLNFGSIGVPNTQQVRLRHWTGEGDDDYHSTTSILDGFGRIVQVRSELSADQDMVATTQFDLLGRTWRTSVAAAKAHADDFVGPANELWSKKEYDVLGRVTRDLNIDGISATMFDYEGLSVTRADALLDPNEPNDPLEIRDSKLLKYDSYGRVAEVTNLGMNPQAGEPDYTTTYEYSVLDNLVKITDGGGSFTDYFDDSLGRMRRMIHPDRGQWDYSYDGAENLIEKKSLTHVVRFDYDALNRMIAKVTDGHLTARFFYDGNRPVNGDETISDQAALYDWGNPINEGAHCQNTIWKDLTVYGPPSVQTCKLTGGPSLIIQPSAPMEIVARKSIAFKAGVRFVLSGANTSLSAKIQPSPPSDPNEVPDWAEDFTLSGNYLIDEIRSSVQFPDGNSEGRIIHEIPESLQEPLIFSLTFQEDPNDPNGASFYVGLGSAGSDDVAAITGDLKTGTGQVVTRSFRVDLTDPNNPPDATKVVLVVSDGSLEVFHTSLTRDVNPTTWVTYDEAPETPPGTLFEVEQGVGRLTAFLDTTGQAAFSYDQRGNIQAERKSLEGLSYITQYSYTQDNLLSQMTYPNGEVVTNQYDDARRLARLGSDRPTSNSPSIGIDLLPNVSYDVHGNVDVIAYGQDNSHLDGRYFTSHDYRTSDLRLGHLQTTLGNSQQPQQDDYLQKLDYSYDFVGNVTGVTDGTTAPGSTEGFAAILNTTYDDLSRLTSVTIPGSPVLVYEYDALGNHTTFEGRPQLYGCVGTAAEGPHQLCRVEDLEGGTGQGFVYDAIGNLVESHDIDAQGQTNINPRESLAFDAENRLLKASLAPLSGMPGSVEVDYDAQGNRVKRVITKASVEKKTLYIGPHYEKRSAEEDGATILYHGLGRLVAERTHADGQPQATTIRYFFADHLGSSSVVWNSNGQPEWVQTYKPYGMDHWSPEDFTEPDDDSYKYTGQEQDFKTLYNFKARSYLPGVGVFAQPDPIDWTPERLRDPQQLNPYAYAQGNPLKYIDPTGEDSLDIVRAWFGASDQQGKQLRQESMRQAFVFLFAVDHGRGTPRDGNGAVIPSSNLSIAGEMVLGSKLGGSAARSIIAARSAVGAAAATGVASSEAVATESVAASETVTTGARGKYGPFYRIESSTQTPADAAKQVASGEIWGGPPKNSMFSDIASAKAARGEMPGDIKGLQFSTDVAPNSSGGQWAYWSGVREGIINEGGWAKIKVFIEKVTQDIKPPQ